MKDFLEYIVNVERFHPLSKKSSNYLPILQSIYASINKETTLLDFIEDTRKKLNISNDFPLECFLHSDNQEEILIDHEADAHHLRFYLENSCSFLHSIHQNIESSKKSFTSEDQLEILVIGGGPAGLLAGIEGYISGGKVTIVEKRTSYTRNTWFDLESLPRSPSLHKLQKWGMKYQEIEHIVHNGVEGIVTIRNQNLEKFLSKIASVLNITIMYDYEYIDYCTATESGEKAKAILHRVSEEENEDILVLLKQKDTRCLLPHQKSSFQEKEFDVIIGCDGDNSVVRKTFDLDFPQQETFQSLEKYINVPDLHQTTMLVNFLPQNGSCPPIKYDEHGEILDARYPGLVLKGITSVFKRFYMKNCQLQVLFTQEKGNEIVHKYKQLKPKNSNILEDLWKEKESHPTTVTEASEWQHDAIPWEFLLKIVNLLFVESHDIESLKSLIKRKNKDASLYDIDIFDVIIKQSQENTKSILNQNNRLSFVTLIGDSSVSAHYRLGVGINNAFRSLTSLGFLMRSLQEIGASNFFSEHQMITKIQDIIEKTKFAQVENRGKTLVQFELSTMFYESYCDYIVLYDLSKREYWQGQQIYIKDRKNLTFHQLLGYDIVNQCETLKRFYESTEQKD